MIRMDEIKCLDHGVVELLDFMGDDQAVVDAARLTHAGNKKPHTPQEDRGLIRYLMRHRHTTPFEMVVFKFRVKAPIFVFRQWHRHRMASINEMSARYSELPEEHYVPELDQIQYQAEANKQGRSGMMAHAANFKDSFRIEAQEHFSLYRYRLSQGMARELARINLPLATYSEMVWKSDLHNLLHFLELRLDKHAQYEIRVYAEAIAKLIKPVVPVTWEAFEDFRLNAVTFSAPELEVLKNLLLRDGPIEPEAGWPTKREQDEFAVKLRKFGLGLLDE